MKFNHFRIVVVILLGALLAVYTNCGQPFGGPSDLIFQSSFYNGSEASYQAFQQTVYPLTRSYCISCHSTQQPIHAADDVKAAHDAVVSQFKVNFGNIPASRLVAKLRDENHNCWGTCSDNAQEMQTAIEKWNDAIKDSGAPSATPPASTVISTSETLPLEYEFNNPNNPLKSNTVQLNIEAAMLKAPMTLVRPVGAPSYIWTPNVANNNLASNDNNAGTANFNFQVPENGSYKIWGNAIGENNNDNSFYLRVFDGNTSLTGNPRTYDINTGSQFEWRQANFSVNLQKGKNYTMELRQKEDGAKLNNLIVTMEDNFVGEELGDYFGVTLNFDLGAQLNMPGVSFKIDVIDYDAFSYKFSNPRIVTNSANVYVKGVKILVNGAFNPQHATYTIVDKIASPMDGKLSDYSMIVLKDKGPSGDTIRFTFDQLALTSGGSTNAGATGGATGGTTGQSSLMAFQATVYPISRSSAYSCVGCHMNVSPRHSSSNTLTAHDAALSVVDFNNPQNSRIVRKMKTERHNCQNFCDSIATEYENAIIEWRNRRQ